jgi:RHS repeat-associated protein
VYDATGRVIAQQDARGYLTSFVFDAAGRPLAVVDANGHRTSNLYDARGMVYATQDPLGALTSYVFDPAGNTVLRVDARNWPTTYTVDALNRVTVQLCLDGTRATFTFDTDGRQLTMQDVTGVTTFQYDAVGRQTSVVNGIGKALAYSFDANGNRTVLVDADSGRTTYCYDVQSRITGIVNPWAEATTLSYDALDREAQRVLGNGTSISRGHDAGGRETLISSPVAVYTASYDAVGNRTTVAELDGSRVTYSYDASYQLTREQRSGTTAIDEGFVYDGLGNRLTKTDGTGITTQTYNAANALLTSQAPSGVMTTSSYDGNGNLTLENAGGALTTYAWDGDNHLLSVAAAGNTQTNTYAADGMRFQNVTNGRSLRYIRDGENVRGELQANNVMRAIHEDLPGVWGGKFAMRWGTSFFYVPDFQGHTRFLLDIAGNLTDTLAYDAWGVELLHNGVTETPFLAYGQFGYFKDAPNRHDVRRRVLRVDLGRWVSRDPIGFAGGDWNVYGYVGNAPAGELDPTGTAPRTRPGLAYCNGARPMLPGNPGRGMVPSDPGYDCYAGVCRRYWGRIEKLESLAYQMCGGSMGLPAIPICWLTNMGLPGLTRAEYDRQCPGCYQDFGTYGRDNPYDNLCCVECMIRVCCWITTPNLRLAEALRDDGLRKCYDQLHPVGPKPPRR